MLQEHFPRLEVRVRVHIMYVEDEDFRRRDPAFLRSFQGRLEQRRLDYQHLGLSEGQMVDKFMCGIGRVNTGPSGSCADCAQVNRMVKDLKTVSKLYSFRVVENID